MAEPADMDAGEITDKGYVNQRKVLASRAGLVEMLYAGPVPDAVIDEPAPASHGGTRRAPGRGRRY